MSDMKRFLVVDDEESIRFTFETFLADAGYQVDAAGSLPAALSLVADNDYDVIFLDILLGRESGMQLLRVMHEKNPNCQVLMVTGSPDIQTASEAVRFGAFDYLIKPVQKDELLHNARLALDRKEMIDRQETFRLRMAAVFESILEGVLIFDGDSRLVDMNASAQKMVGCGNEMVGLSLEELGKSCDCQMIRNFREVVTQRCLGEIFHLQLTNFIGETLAVGLTMSPLTNQSGQENGVVLVLRDENQPSRVLPASID